MAEVLDRRTFVGRAAELARLSALVGAVRDGGGRAVVVGGEAGIGKSRILEQFSEEVERGGARVLTGVCLRATAGELPYAPFVEVLRRLIRETPPQALPALLGPARADLTRLLPELATRAADVPALAATDRTAQVRLFELMVGIVQRLARSSPVVLVVEDVQWADRSTRDLLDYVVRAVRDDPVLLLITLRSEAMASGTAVEWVSELEREAHVERMELGPLTRDEVAALLAAFMARAAPGNVVDRMVDRTDGNPFYIEELALAGSADGEQPLPPVLRDVLAAHVRRLSPQVRDVLRAAAVAGRRIDDELLSLGLSIPGRDLGRLMREAHEGGVLVRGAGPEDASWSFRHELLREVIEDEVLPVERTALHLAFAEALEARAASGIRVPAAQLAEHWDRAGNPARALAPTIEAAREAEQAFAFGRALRLWRRARVLQEGMPATAPAADPDLPTILERAAEAAVLAGEYADSVELGQAALAAVDPATDPARAGHLHERLRWFLWETGDRPAAARAVAAALALIPRSPPSISLARALAQRAGIELLAQDYISAQEDAREAVAVARAAGAPGEVALALGVLGWSVAVLGDVDAGVAHVRKAIAIADEIGSVEGVALGTSSLAALLDRVGRSNEALTAALEGFALTERLGVARTYGGLMLAFAARSQVALGLFDAADGSTEKGLALRPPGRSELWLLVNRGRLLACRGRFDEGSALLRQATEVDGRLGHTEFRVPLLAARLELAAWSGRYEDGRAVVARALEVGTRDGPPDPSLAWLAALGVRVEADLAEVARAARDEVREQTAVAAGQRILAVVAEVERSGRRHLARDRRAGTLTALIAAEGARLRGLDRAADWLAIADGWRELERPLPAAYARYRAAAAALRDREPRDIAAAALAAAHREASALGALPLIGMVERLAGQARIDLGAGAGPLEAAGSRRPAGSIIPNPHHFTERELEVLRLVAGGWTNQQIADHLFITRKTASVHVSNILAKLDVASRAEAAAVAHRLGLVADAPLPPGRG